MGPLEGILRRPGLAAGVVLALAVAALPVVAGLGIDNSVEEWVDRAGPEWATYREFVQRFGSEEFILVVYPLPEAVDHEFLMRLTDLRLTLQEVPGVRTVHDLSGIYARFFPGADPQAFLRDAVATPFYRRFLVSPDGRLGAQWLELDIDRPERRREIVAGVEAAVARHDLGGPVHLAGSPVVNAALDVTSTRAAGRFFPWVFVVSATLLALRYRSVHGVILPFLGAGCALVMTLAVLRLTGGSLDMVTVALPPVLWVLGLATALHLTSDTRRRVAAGEPSREAATAAVRALARPCAASAATTALGFLALATSSMAPVREMGLFAALGVVLCLGANLALFPALGGRWIRRVPAAEATLPTGGSLVRLATLAGRRPGAIVTVAGLAVAVGVVGMSRLEAESDVLTFFPDDHPLVRAYRDVVPQLTGPYSLEILLRPPSGDEPPDAAVLRRVGKVEEGLEAVPGVAKVVSIVDLLALVEQVATGSPPAATRPPESDEAVARAWTTAGDLLPEERSALVRDGEIRLMTLATPMGSRSHRRLVRDLRGVLAERVPDTWRPRLTGIVDLLVSMQTELVRSQIRSFVLAFLVIVPATGLLVGSVRAALLAIPPNLAPILLTLGAMGWLGIPLDPATVMIAALALGIAVDDTIHVLHAWRRHGGHRGDAQGALQAVFARVGRPVATTSMVAAAGFLMLTLAAFRPLVWFGLLTAATLASALAADLLLLPALLVLSGRRSGGDHAVEVASP